MCADPSVAPVANSSRDSRAGAPITAKGAAARGTPGALGSDLACAYHRLTRRALIDTTLAREHSQPASHAQTQTGLSALSSLSDGCSILTRLLQRPRNIQQAGASARRLPTKNFARSGTATIDASAAGSSRRTPLCTPVLKSSWRFSTTQLMSRRTSKSLMVRPAAISLASLVSSTRSTTEGACLRPR